MHHHDVPAGPLRRCQITGSDDLELVIDLGHQPPCNALVDADRLDYPETTYPLRLWHSATSGLGQLDYVVEGSEIYFPDYPYRSGISEPLVDYQRGVVDDIIRMCGIPSGALCVDVGSNDGTLLKHFKRAGMRTLGVEPTNIASIARAENGIETIQGFFTEALAHDIVRDHGRARLATMTNVFAHMATLGEVMRGLTALLDDDGVFVTESHYLLDVLDKDQFDTIYHEHIRTYSLKSLRMLFDYYDLEVFHVERGDRYGGNIRAYVARKGRRPIGASVARLTQAEADAGLHEAATWRRFRERVHENRDRVMEFLCAAHRQGRSIGGYSCPGRAVPLLNFYGVRADLLPYISELPNSLKLGKYVPGVHIPIVSSERLQTEKPEIIIVLAWHYRDVIIKRLRREGSSATLVTLLPTLSFSDVANE